MKYIIRICICLIFAFTFYKLGLSSNKKVSSTTSWQLPLASQDERYSPTNIYFLGDSITSKDKEGLSYSLDFEALLHKAQKDLHLFNIPMENIAVGGSTPANWDNETVLNDPNVDHGTLSTRIDKINDTNQLFILTLGGNPLLDMWSDKPYKVLSIKKLQEDIDRYKSIEHLVNIYKRLLKHGDVIAVKYYHVVPDLGFYANLFIKLLPKEILNNGADQLNVMIDKAVKEAQIWAKETNCPYRIISLCPAAKGGYCDGFEGHSKDDNIPYMKADGIHPNKQGHKVMAKNILSLTCRYLGHFCKETKYLDFSPKA